MKKEKHVYCLFNVISILLPLLGGMFGGPKAGAICSIIGCVVVAYAPYIAFHIPFKKDFKSGKTYKFLVYYEALMLIIFVLCIF